MKIKKNDTVVVLSGKDKGKQGKVLSTMPTVGKVLVEGINMADCHVRAPGGGLCIAGLLQFQGSPVACASTLFPRTYAYCGAQ